MPAQIISGTEIAKQIREELKEEIAKLKEQHNLVPGLATVLVGEDPASQVYVGQKEKTSKALGLYSERHDLPADTGEEELLALVDKLNKDPKIHGILVQLPLPKHINETKVLYAIDPKKDVDGFHPVNLGKLMIGEPDYLPCTPHGIQQLLVRSGVELEGAEVVVVGRSNIVVTADMVREGVVVIDVGVNRIGKTAEGKAILVGDVDFDAVKEKARAITPVPGGVGPMTITMLMLNTVKAAKLAAGLI
jgi:methylenetetrahydrofolate dehydrogenase (NADP+)/methenyltetrahydrofolate cyclohydrolase